MNGIFMLNVYLRGMYGSSFLVSILTSLYAGAFVELKMRLNGLPSLCNFISHLSVGAVRFKLKYLNLLSFRMSFWIWLIVCLSTYCSFLVISLSMTLKILLFIKSVILDKRA